MGEAKRNRESYQQQRDALQNWIAGLDQVHERIAGRFARTEQRGRVRAYLEGIEQLIKPLNYALLISTLMHQ
jgi:hypothetical protein